MRVAIVGGGISGLTCGRAVQQGGHDVTIFDKSRGVGGRMATRRVGERLRFDHGAQYFTAREPQFQATVADCVARGIVAEWDGRIGTLRRGQLTWHEKQHTRYVGVPGMNALCRHLAEGLHVQLSACVAVVDQRGSTWSLHDDEGASLGEFDVVVTSAPAAQSATLLSAAPALAQQAAAIAMQGCWAVMLAFDKSLELGFDAAFVHESPLAWIARNSSKPERDRATETWVLHASPEWTEPSIDREPAEVLPLLKDAFWEASGLAEHAVAYETCHRWRYSIPPEPLAARCLFDETLRIGACGDWCGGPRVEGAFLSGRALAERVLSVA